MQETIEQKIERFKNFNLEQINRAVSLSDKGLDNIHSTILLCSMFDSLSKARFSNQKSNSKRFKKMIQECKTWTESQHISLLHLVRAFEENEENQFKDVKQWSIEKLKGSLPEDPKLVQRSPGIKIDIDPNISELEELCPKRSNVDKLKINNTELSRFKHENLFWCYRNSVVHEYRIPGNGVEDQNPNTDYPYYMKINSLDHIPPSQLIFQHNWELVYPMKFFERICLEANEIVAEWYQKQNTSPFKTYSEGSYWIPNLNQDL